MSCHSIGRGLATVTKEVFRMHDQKEINERAAKRLIRTAKKAVHWCDGNEDEAIDCAIACRCGNCLRKMHLHEKIYSPFFGTMSWNLVTDEIENQIAYATFCTSCLKKLFDANVAEKVIEDNIGRDESIVSDEWEE